MDGSENSILNPDPSAEGHLTIQPVQGALNSLKIIQKHGYEIHIISRIDFLPVVNRRVRCWLGHHGFETVVPQYRVHFCEKWHEKADICRQILPCYFVDDRLEVLQHLVDVVPNLFVFRPRLADQEERPLIHLITSGRVKRVDDWPSLVAAIPAA